MVFVEKGDTEMRGIKESFAVLQASLACFLLWGAFEGEAMRYGDAAAASSFDGGGDTAVRRAPLSSLRGAFHVEEDDGPRVVRILSIDGGGLRGAIPCQCLIKMEENLGRGFGIAEGFDVITGTSTGGILGIGLSLRNKKTGRPLYRAADLMKLYTNHGEDIFPPKQRKKVLTGLFKVKYDPAPLEMVLREQLQDATLCDVEPLLLVAAHDVQLDQLFMFDSARAKSGEVGMNFYLRDVARATSAAPTYFPQAKIWDVQGHQERVFVDGGVVANHPAAHAFWRARELYPQANYFEIVSLGTGRCDRINVGSYLGAESQLNWARYIPSLMMEGASQGTNFLLEKLARHSQGESYKLAYTRMQAALAPEEVDMDVAEEAMMRRYMALGGRLYEEHQGFLEAFFERLFQNPLLRLKGYFFRKGNVLRLADSKFEGTDLNFGDEGFRDALLVLKETRHHQSLTHFYGGQNGVSHVDEDAFEGFEQLLKLKLNSNVLHALPQGLFRGLGKLTILDLTENRLQELEEDLLRPLASLKVLYLRNNKIKSLPLGFFLGLGRLEELRLEYNNIERLEENAFEGLGALRFLNLIHNHLWLLQANTFKGLCCLEELRLGENYLKGIEGSQFRVNRQRRFETDETDEVVATPAKLIIDGATNAAAAAAPTSTSGLSPCKVFVDAQRRMERERVERPEVPTYFFI